MVLLCERKRFELPDQIVYGETLRFVSETPIKSLAAVAYQDRLLRQKLDIVAGEQFSGKRFQLS